MHRDTNSTAVVSTLLHRSGWGALFASLVLAMPVIGCPPMPDKLLSGEEHDALALKAWAEGPAKVDPAWMQAFLAANGLSGGEGGVAGFDPAEFGQWAAPQPWPVIAIHGALMTDGRVLHYSYPDATPGSRARLWNPSTGAFSSVNASTDLFCSGLSHLEDGSLYVTGGNDTQCTFQGRNTTFTFKTTPTFWTPQGTMATKRWYPTNLTLGDGSVIITSGLNNSCELTDIMERYVPGAGLSVVDAGEDFLDLFPRLHLLSDGRIVHTGTEAWARTFDFDSGWQFIDWQDEACYRYAGGSVLLPGAPDRVMVFAGSCGPVLDSAEIIDLAQPSPQWTAAAPMHFARAHLNPVILPDGTILCIGGGETDLYGDPVMVPELYDPQTNTWTVLPPHVYGRMYHSTALLLPDGRVIVAGQDDGDSAYFGEIYSPPYLFRGLRPAIATAPIGVVHGQPFEMLVVSEEEDPIEKVVMVKLGSTTHSVNFDQRLVELAFTSGPGPVAGSVEIVAGAPSSANMAPPGYYMLMVLDDDDVPSPAKIVQVKSGVFGDLDGDGEITGGDLGVLLAAWGPGSGPADLNVDGVVDGADVGLLLAAWS